MSLRLLHTADWHLGRRFPLFTEADETALTRARLEAVARILELARDAQVDAVLCAGDLFEEPTPAAVWYEGLARCFDKARYRGPIFLLPGNHDPLLPDSVYAPDHPFRELLPRAVHVVDRDDYAHPLPGGAVLLAAPCRARASERTLAGRFPPRAAGDDRLRIGLLHGTTVDIAGHVSNFPIPKETARQAGLDYLALGDTHSFRDVWPDEPAPTVYPGTPEPTSFGEEAPGYVAIVALSGPGERALVRRERVAGWTWRQETCRHPTELARLCAEPLADTVLRLSFEMTVGIREQAEVDSLLLDLAGTASTRGLAGILAVDRSGIALCADVAPEAWPDDLPPLLQQAIHSLQARAEHPELGPRANRALYHLWNQLEKR